MDDWHFERITLLQRLSLAAAAFHRYLYRFVDCQTLFILDEKHEVAFLLILDMDYEVFLVQVVMDIDLLLLLLLVSVERINVSVFELEGFVFASFKDCWENDLFQEVSVRDDVKFTEFKAQWRKSLFWEFLGDFLVDEVHSLLAVAALHINTIGLDIVLSERPLIEVIYGLNSCRVLGV